MRPAHTSLLHVAATPPTDNAHASVNRPSNNIGSPVAKALLIFRSALLTFSLALLLAGCVLPGGVAAPTPYPADYIPTVIYLTAQSINATISADITPTAAPTLVPTDVPSTPVPTLTPTPAPGIPLAAIQINAPGPMSRIVSPVEVHAMVTVDEGYRVETALYDEIGQVISRPALVTFSSPGSFPVSAKMPFEIRAAGETGVVQMSIKDSHGRLLSLISLHVLLLSAGSSQINPAGNTIYERVVFYGLPSDSNVSGGSLAIKGRYDPVTGKPVIAELISNDGKSLGLRVLNLPGTDWQPFDSTIPYKVSAETPARLFIYQDDDIIQGRAYVYSQPIILSP
jgi:hypothetical protein